MTTENTINATRNVMGKFLGEIITEVIGNDRIQKLMETVPHQQSENAGIPTGEIALKAGVITADTKTALLVAQAAERTYALAKKAEAVAATHEEKVAKGETIEATKDAGYVAFDDAVFKFVGSERDPAILQYAQGVWQASQVLFNNEVNALNSAVKEAGTAGNPTTMGFEAAQGFKNAAVGLYAVAAELMQAAGHTEAANKLDAVAQSLAVTAEGPTPSATVKKLKFDHEFGTSERNRALMIIGNESSWGNDEKYLTALDKLIKLTDASASAGAVRHDVTPTPQAPQHNK